MHFQKKNILKYLAFGGISIFAVLFSSVYAADSIAAIFISQSASSPGSNNSIISTDANLSYINKGNNSSVIGNYFTGYYYDSILGYFNVDWSSDSFKNVRVIGSTSQCGSSYGYKLGGYAYSTAFGFIDFDYNSNIFVYYCLSDKNLHGYAYNEDLGFQNFEGIHFEINVKSDVIADVPTGTGFFVNDDTQIVSEPLPNSGNADDSNFTASSIQNDIIEFDVKKESLFYIIK